MQRKLVKNLVTLLFPLQSEMRILFTHSEVTISAVWPIIGGLLWNHLITEVSDDKFVKQFKEEVEDKLNLAFKIENDELDVVSVHQISTFFDPRHKKLLHTEFTEEGRQQIFQKIQKVVADISSE